MKRKLELFFTDFFSERGIEVEVNDFKSTNLIDSGLLDSFEVLTLLINLEVELGIKLSPESLYDDGDKSISGLIDNLLSILNKT